MIVKKIKCKKTSKTKARQIADLVDYIRQPKGGQSTEKVEHSGSQNFLASRHEGQRLEMIALAAESIHSRMPVSHYVFSWKAHEQPTAAQVDELVDIFLKELGLEGCQTVYGLHWNAETQPRPQEENTTSTIRENTKDTSTPVRRMRMR